ncbi:MAG TPA: autotransporter-associated beta strand repeat-containing protein, partial [Candidatus Binatia bacterium]|nr:autotransporter-associated beta strand repeat-containing protein [Candidatus Binatia bacterium]
ANYTTTITNTTSLHSLVQQGDMTVNSGVTLTLDSGGLILRGPSRWLKAGSSTTSFLTSGSGTGEFFVHTPNPTATDYRLWPVIKDNGATPLQLIKDGAGFVALANNNNTYSGGTVVNAGVLAASAVGGSATIAPFGTGNVTVNKSELRLGSSPGNAFGGYVYTNAITLNGATANAFDGFHFLQGALTISASGGTLGATFDNKNDALLNGYAKGLFIDGFLSGSGPLTVQDSGLETVNAWDSSTVYFRNMGTAAQNTYSGTISVIPFTTHGGSYLFLIGTNALANATINLTGDNDASLGRFGAPTLLFGSGTNANGIGYATIGGLAGYGNFPVANTLVTQSGSSIGGPFALSVGNNNLNTTYYGIMSGSGSLIKVGAGTLTLSGANTYTGNTTISSGTLALSGGSIASTNIILSRGATFDVSPSGSFTLGGSQSLYGGGTVNGYFYTSAGSKIYAGTDGGYGTNTFNNDLSLDSSATTYFDVGTLHNGSNDLISVSGTLYANNNVIHLKAPSTSDSLEAADYVLFKSPNTIAGSFASAPTWDVAPVNAAHYSIVTGANTVTLHYSTVAGPSGAGFATPSPAVRNQSVLLTVNAVNGTAGTVNSVTVDASAIGGSSTLALVNSGGNVWTNTVAVAPATSPGAKTLVATLTDTAALSSLVNIPLTVVVGNDVWNGAGPDSNFSSNLNWTNQTAPGYVGDSLEFAGNTKLTPNMDNNYTATGLTFDNGAGSFTIGTANSSTLGLTGGLTNNSANTQTLNVPLSLSGSSIINAAAGNLAVGGAVSGSGGLTKLGNSTLTLSASGNTMSGNMSVLGGTLN